MSDVTRIAGQAQTFTYRLLDAQNNLITPLSAPQQSIHATSADAATGANPLNGPVALTGSAGTYTATYPVGLATGTYYLRTVTALTGSTTLTDIDDRLILVTVTGGVGSPILVLADAKAQVNITTNTQDAEIQSYVDAVNATVEAQWGPIAPTLITEHHGNARSRVTVELNQRPVYSVTTVTEFYTSSATVLTVVNSRAAAVANCVLLEADSGILRRISSSGNDLTFFGPLEIVYTAGVASTPPDVNLAARIIFQEMWRTQNGGSGLPAIGDGGPMAPPGHLLADFIPPRAELLLDAWRAERTRFDPGIA